MKREEILAELAAGKIKVEEATQALEEIRTATAQHPLFQGSAPRSTSASTVLQRMPVTLYVEQWDRLLALSATN